MPRLCSVCSSPERDAIDRAIVAGESFRGIAAKYRVSPDAVERHAAAHIPTRLALAARAEEVSHADALLRQVRDLNERAWRILDMSEEAGDFKVALAAIREARGCLELLGKLLGTIDQGASVNIVLSAEWTHVRTELLAALVPYPAARIAVADRLVALEVVDAHRG